MPEIDMEWGKMYVELNGSLGVPLLVLEGTGCDSVDWDEVREYMDAEQREIRMDFRGHG